ncbi:hypothetical protein A33M_1045 [Rhodovulum sp. PH10]|nr:hypothetical protein A33M_1045 [Rhodovulum sp. PH10]
MRPDARRLSAPFPPATSRPTSPQVWRGVLPRGRESAETPPHPDATRSARPPTSPRERGEVSAPPVTMPARTARRSRQPGGRAMQWTADRYSSPAAPAFSARICATA